jgi:predicted tellurium resistance membrane protein TerC
MTNQNKAGESDKPYLVIAAGIFSLVLLIVTAFYQNIGAMAPLLKGAVILGYIVVGVLWYICLKKIDSPNHDVYRYWLIGLIVLLIIVVMAHRAGWYSDKMFRETVEETKMR